MVKCGFPLTYFFSVLRCLLTKGIMKFSVTGNWAFLAGLLIVAGRSAQAVDDSDGSLVTSLPAQHATGIVQQLPSSGDLNPVDFIMKDSPNMGPYFDSETPLNVTAQLGKTAYLHCQVRHLGNKTVSWFRHRDLHILTVGRYTYISDQRFQAYHLADTDDWTLQVRYVQQRDAGIYECQVSTEPKMSLLITLNVVVPKSVIKGGPDLYVKTGSTITLHCVITESPTPPVFVFWYHESDVLNYNPPRRTIHVESVNADTTVSRLLITDAQSTDSGNYTCSPSNADSAGINVHVLNGEKPAAMQHGKLSAGCRCNLEETVFLVVSSIWFVCELVL